MPPSSTVPSFPASTPFACPNCRAQLEPAGTDCLVCQRDGMIYRCEDGIWRFLLPDRRLALEPFIQEYSAVRRLEGRGSPDPAYYQALPFRDLSGRFRADWRIRARSYRELERRVLFPLEKEAARPLRALDLGSGPGWLAYRLAQRGHAAAAVDLLTDDLDGLGAGRHYPTSINLLQAEFDRLPLPDGAADLAIFNASFHYSTDYALTLAEALRVLMPGGRVVLLDTPVYREPASGAQMVQERQDHFRRAYGFASDALASENFLTYRRLDELAAALGLEWQLSEPFYGLRWALRPWRARLQGRREPARFILISGRRRGAG